MSETTSFSRAVRQGPADESSDLVAESQARLITYFERLSASPEASRRILEHILSSSAGATFNSNQGTGLHGGLGTSTFGRRIDSVLATIDGGLLTAVGGQNEADLFGRSAPLTVPADWVLQLSGYSTVEDPGFVMPDVTADPED